MDFSEFSLQKDLQKGIAAAGYVKCTPVQEQVLKVSLDGVDLYVQSQTGTGKTAAYLVTIVEQMLKIQENAGKKALVMVPTRELAVQVEEEAKKLCKFTGLIVFSFYGGVGYEKQTGALKRGVNILVGTPGRVIDLQESGQMDLDDVKFLVIDEADRMFDMGFYPDLRKLIKVLPVSEERQTMLFSATLNSYVKNLAWEYTREPVEITIDADNITVEEIDQELFHVSSDEKMKLLLGLLKRDNPDSVLIFCNTKRSCEVIAKRLQINGLKSDFIIGDLPQSKRLKVLEDFESGKLPILVATDVAARGIDIADLAMVINYDLPNEEENYVHRIGRTARAGKSGKAYTFCSEQDVYNLPSIERYIETKIPSQVADASMMQEDTSAGQYVRTEDWREEGDTLQNNNRSRNDRRDAKGRRERSGKIKSRFKSDTASVNDTRFRAKGKNKKDTHEKKRHSRTRKDEIDLSMLENMPFEERMKVYKQKYCKNKEYTSPIHAAAAKTQHKEQQNRRRRQGNNKKITNINASALKNDSSAKLSGSIKESTVQKKRSLLDRLKSLFARGDK